MNKTNDGGPAFPRDSHIDSASGLKVQQNGMSLRDYFAAKAMQGMAGGMAGTGINEVQEEIAKRSYAIADAMLKARGEQ